jgi:hypothetical protein
MQICSLLVGFQFPQCSDAPHTSRRCKEVLFLCAPGTVCKHLGGEWVNRDEKDPRRYESCGCHGDILGNPQLCTGSDQASRTHISFRHPISDPEYCRRSCRPRRLNRCQRCSHGSHYRARRSLSDVAGDVSDSKLEIQSRHKTRKAGNVHNENCSDFPAPLLFCGRPLLHSCIRGSRPESRRSKLSPPRHRFCYLS